jgi:hypothetical protein
LGVKPVRQVSLGEAISQRVVGLPLGWLSPVCTEDAEIAAVYERQHQATDPTGDGYEGYQGRC